MCGAPALSASSRSSRRAPSPPARPAAGIDGEQEEALLREAAGAIRATPAELPARLAGLLEERKRLERELSEARRLIASGGSGPRAAAKDLGGVKYAGRAVANMPAKELKSLADDMKRDIGSGVVAVVASADGKASLVVGVTDDLTARFNAVDLGAIVAEARCSK